MKQGLQSLPIDTDVIFTNHKGEHKKGVEKRQRKFLDKISFLEPFLREDEKILLVTTGWSPTSFLEQLLTGWVVIFMKSSLFVFTTHRIFHIPTKLNHSYRRSIAHIPYARCQSVERKRRYLIANYRSGAKEKFILYGSREMKKISELLKIQDLTREIGPPGERGHLCPRCTQELTPVKSTCPHCRLEFKTKAAGMKLSIIFPGGGYFYTGHPILGIFDAIAESILLVFCILGLASILKGDPEGWYLLVVFGIFLFFEKAITIYHANDFLKEFLPKEKNIEVRLQH